MRNIRRSRGSDGLSSRVSDVTSRGSDGMSSRVSDVTSRGSDSANR